MPSSFLFLSLGACAQNQSALAPCANTIGAWDFTWTSLQLVLWSTSKLLYILVGISDCTLCNNSDCLNAG